MRVLDDMLYLGAWLSANGSNSKEIGARKSAAWKRWNCFAYVWSAALPLRVRLHCVCVYTTKRPQIELSNFATDYRK